MITKEEIEACGWMPETILIEKDMLDSIADPSINQLASVDGDVYIEGWSIIKDDKTWWEMCRNSRRLLIVKKEYRNEVGQNWNVVMDIVVSDKQELLGEMSYLGIKKS